MDFFYVNMCNRKARQTGEGDPNVKCVRLPKEEAKPRTLAAEINLLRNT